MNERNFEQRAALPAFPVPSDVPEAAAGWSLRVGGLVRTEQRFSLDTLAALPLSTLTAPFTCEEGWQVQRLVWRGVPLRRLLASIEPLPDARYAAVGAGAFVTVLPLSELDE